MAEGLGRPERISLFGSGSAGLGEFPIRFLCVLIRRGFRVGIEKARVARNQLDWD
jgi:hypothetical protein